MTHPVELRIVYAENDDRCSSSSSSSSASSVSGRKTFLMYAEADWTVSRVKREFAQVREIKDWKNYKFFLNGQSLRGKYLLADYHINNGNLQLKL